MRIESVIRNVLRQPDLVLKPELTAHDIPGWDSLSNVRIVVALEKEFKVTIKAHEIVKLTCLGDLFRLIENKAIKA